MEKDNWIDEKTDKPFINKNVLVAIKDEFDEFTIDIARWTGKEWYRPWKQINVTHWKPLPEPPKPPTNGK